MYETASYPGLLNWTICAGVCPTHCFSDLVRYTCATLMLANAVDARTVQDILGHSDVATTLRFYGYVLPSMRQRAGAVFDEAKPTTASLSEAGDAS